MEIWKVIENLEGYMISNFGRVKSLKKNIMLTPSMNNWGYLRVKLSQDGKRYRLLIHRLVLKSFKPNEDLNKTECNHKDGNKENNYVENLEWCTRSDNMKHAYKLGFGGIGEKSGRTVLTNTKVKIIKQILSSPITKQLKITQKEIAEVFGISKYIISRIKLGKSWSHIKAT